MIKKLWLKSCRRCHGDMTLEKDRWGAYRACIQCGHSEELPQLMKVREPLLAGQPGRVA